MEDYEAIAARLANALRETLNLHKRSGNLNGSDYRTVLRARSTLWDFDNRGALVVRMPSAGACFKCKELVQPEPEAADGCPFCGHMVYRP